MKRLVALNGSPARGGNIEQMLEQICAGFREAGGEARHIHCASLIVKPCQACGPDATTGYCIFHDDMDQVYLALEQATAVVVASPIYFDTVSAQLKLVIDRCNCVIPLVRFPGGGTALQPRWERNRRGVFVTSLSGSHRHDLAERTVRGFMKWVGTRWEETFVYAHEDDELGSVGEHPEVLERARQLGRKLVEDVAADIRR